VHLPKTQLVKLYSQCIRLSAENVPPLPPARAHLATHICASAAWGTHIHCCVTLPGFPTCSLPPPHSLGRREHVQQIYADDHERCPISLERGTLITYLHYNILLHLLGQCQHCWRWYSEEHPNPGEYDNSILPSSPMKVGKDNPQAREEEGKLYLLDSPVTYGTSLMAILKMVLEVQSVIFARCYWSITRAHKWL